MRYVVAVYVVGFLINLINPNFYYEWLMLDLDKLVRGQIWRIVTFLIQPVGKNIILTALMLYVYFSIGTTLEKVWGTFRFNLFYFMGILSNIITVIIVYFIWKAMTGTGISYPVSLEHLNMSMFLAFAITFPELRFYLMFLIPVKAKWLSIAYVVIFGYDIVAAFVGGGLYYGILITVVTVIPLLNVLLYFLMVKRYLISPKQIRRRNDFNRSFRQGQAMGYTTSHVTPEGSNRSQTIITRHKCAICGRTELDGDHLQFRFCSKCNGNYEYCQDHLFTHEHIQ